MLAKLTSAIIADDKAGKHYAAIYFSFKYI